LNRAARTTKDDTELDDEAIVAFIRSFITVMAADWRRRQLNAVLPSVMKQVDAARAAGHEPDVRAILDKVWIDRKGPAGLLDS
jgi:hypothetical protein